MAALAWGLQVIKKQEYDSHNLFLVEEIENLDSSLNDEEWLVFKEFQGEIVIRHDPERGDNVIGNLVIFCALSFEEVWEDLETRVFCEDVSQLIGLQEIHEGEGVGLNRNLEVTSLLKQPTHEFSCWLLAIFEASCSISKND